MVGGWVWDLANVRGGPSIFFCRPLVFRFVFYGFFTLPSPRSAQKRDKTKPTKNRVFGYFFLQKVVDRTFLETVSVVLLKSYRCETPENTTKPKKRGKTDIVFLSFFCGVFELHLSYTEKRPTRYKNKFKGGRKSMSKTEKALPKKREGLPAVFLPVIFFLRF
jgi:hypothetical protein